VGTQLFFRIGFILLALATTTGYAGDQTEGYVSPTQVSFRCVETAAGSRIEVKTSTVVFLAPFLKISARGWPGEADIYPSGGAFVIKGKKGFRLSGLSGTRISIDPITTIERDATDKSDSNVSSSEISFRCVSTKTGPMIGIKKTTCPLWHPI
jgi:hypothetical protein